MKNHRTVRHFLTALVLLPLLLSLGCRSDTDRSEGAVLLSISNFNGLPSAVSLNSQPPPFVIDDITVRNIAKDPTGTDERPAVRRAAHARDPLPAPRHRHPGTAANVQSVFGLVPVNGTTTLTNIPFLTSDQVFNQPLKDLRDTGRDSETGTAVVVLDVSMRVFGRTLSGDDIVSDPARFTIEVRP